MLEYAEVDSSNLIVAPVPRWLPTVPKGKDNPKLPHGPKFRPVVFRQPEYDPTKQRLSTGFVYHVDGPVVVKTPQVLDLSAQEIDNAKTETTLAHIRQVIPNLEPTIAALARVATELLRVCGNLDGPGMRPEVSKDDLDKIQAFAAIATNLEL